MLNKVSIGALIVPLVLGFIGQSAFAAGPAAVNLGMAGNFVILAKTGISTTGSTSILGDIGISPNAAIGITGLALTLPAASAFSTSAFVTGKVYAPDYANPTPANLTTAVNDMQTAYTDAAGRTNPTATELGAGNIGGMTLAPGLYKWGTNVTIPTDVTLSGGANDVWIFQIAGNLTMSSAMHVVLSGGAQAGNIFWAVAGQTTVGTTAAFNGNILDQTTIALQTGATLNGRALAQAAVTLDSNNVTVPTYSAPAVPATPSSGSGTSATPATPAVPATPASPANAALKLQLNGLLATLQALQLKAQQQGFSVSASPSAFGQQVKAIVANLTLGSAGNNVKALQQFLISQGKGSAAQALATNGATTHFGALTRAALAEFQASAGITPASGYFGAKTRAYISAH